jgi:hypothetical protein
MRKIAALAALAGCLMATTATAQTTLSVNNSTGDNGAGWVGYVNLFEPPFELGFFRAGFPMGLDALTATFDDQNNVVDFQPVSVVDPNEYWFLEQPGGDPTNPNDNGGPGAEGAVDVEAFFYQEVAGPNLGSLAGQTVTFEGEILSDTLSSGYDVSIIIRDFAPGFGSFNEVSIPAVPGPFSLSIVLGPQTDRPLQYGFRMVGRNIWFTELASVGSLEIATVGEPPVEPCVGDIADEFGTLGGDGQVDFGDFLALLGLIGPCP